MEKINNKRKEVAIKKEASVQVNEKIVTVHLKFIQTLKFSAGIGTFENETELTYKGTKSTECLENGTE